jgi:Uncharacterized protein conserved in bacteria (DUF2252)
MTTSAGVIVLPSSSIARAPRSSGNAVPRGAQRIGGRLAKHLMQHRCRSCFHYARVGDIVADGSNRCLYFEGVSRSPGTDPLSLQIKDKPPSAYASFLPKSTVCHSKQAHRVVDGQRAMQLTSDHSQQWTAVISGTGRSDRFDRAIFRFSRAYADKTESDWDSVKKFDKGKCLSLVLTSAVSPSLT